MDMDIISFIFDMKENEGFFQNSNNSNYKIFLNIQQEKSNLLNDYINTNIDKNIRDNLISLIESYIEAICDTYYCEFKIYYKSGFKDGLEIITK